MPADITGTNIVQENVEGEKFLQFQQGPIFANIVLADEINRATPKTQSALLEAMEEKTVSVGKITYKLDPPFFVLATQNPLEMEGTYPLPEAQLDRFFMKLKVDYPTLASLHSEPHNTREEPQVNACSWTPDSRCAKPFAPSSSPGRYRYAIRI
jgi:MoxR-like ATPase